MANYHPTIGSQVRLTVRPTNGWGGRSLAWRLVSGWLRHRRNRRELLELDSAQLNDTGITREALRQALEEPFWRSPEFQISYEEMETTRSRAMQARTEHLCAKFVHFLGWLRVQPNILRGRAFSQARTNLGERKPNGTNATE